MQLNSAKDLDVYKVAYQLAMEIFEVTKGFPAEERFALTGQIRRRLAHASRRFKQTEREERYEAHFVSKLTDCDGENSETSSSLDFARDCKYITVECHSELTTLCHQIGKMLGSVIKNPAPFLVR